MIHFKSINFIFLLFLLISCGTNKNIYKPNKEYVPNNLEKVSYSSIPNWKNDDLRYALQSFRNSCRAKIQYKGLVVPKEYLLQSKCRNLPNASASNKEVRLWFENNFQPYKIYDNNNKSFGTFTGYYSPVIPACTQKTNFCNEPIMAKPKNNINFKNIPKKRIVNEKIGEILYWANIVDVQNLQIQGSGVLKVNNGKYVKLNFSGTNDMPFKSIGTQLKNRGIRPKDGYSANSVWTYLKQHPSLAKELIYNNPRYIYFKPSTSHAVIGKLGTPLSQIRSIAVDDSIYTLGLPMYISTQTFDGKTFQRLMIAQDTGSAIKGWIRADIFFGSGDIAYKYAHSQHSQGEMYILMPK